MCEHDESSQESNRKHGNCNQTKFQSILGRHDRRKNRLNVAQQLVSRETSKRNEHFPYSFITKEPLKKFKLRKIVNELGNGHVFLGFTKNGQFIVSYSLQIDADEIIFPVYNYKLYWWHFVPNCPLRLISEVNLFGEHEINQDLQILVCQWPSDETKILVYGFYRTTEWLDQQSLQQCYITITAIPSLEYCANCSKVEEGRKLCLCLEHSFTIHTQYQLAPPFPDFVPTICLKIDGTVIINTSDSLVALSVCLNLNSVESTTDVSKKTNNTNGEKSDNHKMCSNKDEKDETCKLNNDRCLINCDKQTSVLNDQSWMVISSDECSNANEASTSYKDEFLFVSETYKESAKENISPQNCPVMTDLDETLKSQKDKTAEMKKDGVYNSNIKLNNASSFLSCVTCTKRLFADHINTLFLDEDDDSSNNGYHNCLPLEVHGLNYGEMRCLPFTRRTKMVKQSIVVEQQTFDVEQFVHEVANRLCSNSGKKYLAVDDYDIQVVDVDPGTGDITGLAFILIKATCNNIKNQLKFRYSSNFYQTKLILVWNIYTGENRMELLLYFSEKTESANTEQLSCCKTPQIPLHYQLEKIMENLPKPEMKSIKVLSNLPALKGSSLTSIVSPYQHIALVL